MCYPFQTPCERSTRKPMTQKTLTQLYASHTGKVSDKWSSYLVEYDRLFNPYRHKPINLLEIGIQNGGSIEIWAKYFEKAQTIIGCDINPDCESLRYDDPRISIVVGDANATKTYQKITKINTGFDLIIDDGSHTSGDIIQTFDKYFPQIKEDGLFVAEDLHCSYWKNYEGGLFNPHSSISFFKLLADIINHEHWGVDKKTQQLIAGFNKKYHTTLKPELLKQVHSIKFINSICVIRKQKHRHNKLGKRFISGMDESVVSGHFMLHGSTPTAQQQTANKWSIKDQTPYEELPLLETQLDLKNQALNQTQSQLTTQTQQLLISMNQSKKLEQELKKIKITVENLKTQCTDVNHQLGTKESSLELANKEISNLSKKLKRAEEIIDNILSDKKYYNKIRQPPKVLNPISLFKKSNRLSIKEQRQITKSKTFSAAYYLIHNPDVWGQGINPLSHFTQYGWKEGRNPNANFDTKLYQQDYPDIEQEKINPLLRYISYGKKEGRLVGFKYSPKNLGQDFTHEIIQNKILFTEKNHKYLCLFSHFDKNNIIHRYVLNYLKELSRFADIIFISTSSELSEQEIKKISHLCKQIIIKKNTGYDFGAWKTGMLLAETKLQDYQYLILCNDSVYGPFKNLEKIIISGMRENDVFGLTESKEINHHLQSYFVVYSQKAFNHAIFSNFWDNIKIYSNKKRLILENEVKYHNRLINSNLNVSSLCPVIKGGAKNQLHYEWQELIQSRDFPFIKIELLRDNPLKVDINEWESVIEKLSYDPLLIKEHLNVK